VTAETISTRDKTTADDVPAIVIEGARKAYGATAVGRSEAVAGVSLRVARGTVHGLLGPNGAGKTTTLKMLLGLVRPTAGTFEIAGVPADAPGARSGLGFLPEQPYFPPLLKASEVLRLHGRLLGLDPTAAARQGESLLKKVGLEGAGSTRLHRFSRGMLQRLGLAQALLGSPEVMVLDEPAGGLDPVGQRDVRNIIMELRERGVAVLLSSHQLSEVEAICDEVTIMNRGQVAAVGHIDDLLNSEGQTSIRARGDGSLPESVSARTIDSSVSGGVTAFSVADEDVRFIVDALDDDAGWRMLSVAPKRDSLEGYFERLLEDETPDGGVVR
jgi:ABC-2 type transport system ATP-binding protein